VQPCCWMCNRSKSNCTKEEFSNWINRLINNNTEKLVELVGIYE
jgi:hypothetical protein